MSLVKASTLSIGDVLEIHGENVRLYDIVRMGGTTALHYQRPDNTAGTWLVAWEQIVEQVEAFDHEGSRVNSYPDNTLDPTGTGHHQTPMPQMPPIPVGR